MFAFLIILTMGWESVICLLNGFFRNIPRFARLQEVVSQMFIYLFLSLNIITS